MGTGNQFSPPHAAEDHAQQPRGLQDQQARTSSLSRSSSGGPSTHSDLPSRDLQTRAGKATKGCVPLPHLGPHPSVFLSPSTIPSVWPTWQWSPWLGLTPCGELSFRVSVCSLLGGGTRPPGTQQAAATELEACCPL